MAYRRILTIQDISCIGQCSMTVALPVLSACGHEICILPTAVLSTHTGGFQQPSVQNLTEQMESVYSHWKREGITFDLIYTGYLGSVQAIEETKKIIDTMLSPSGVVIVDPAMADHGKLYRGFDEAYAAAMGQLCCCADVMIPNITEAAMMTGVPYLEHYEQAYIHELMQKLPGKQVLLTGVGFAPDQTGFALRVDGKTQFVHHKRLERSYHGTGDLFASAFVGALACGKEPLDAAKIASEFTLKSIQNTYDAPAHWYGVKFEPALADLIEMLK